jgi:hypothetical protein
MRLAMYHWIVDASCARSSPAWARAISGRCWTAWRRASSYRFEGDSPIGGVRDNRGSMQLWWERMYRLFPGLSFVVQDVVVRGGPWHTRIFTQLEFVKPLPDGTRYRNVVMQRMVMRWGRITEIHTLEDTQRCMRLLAWQAGRERRRPGRAISDVEWPPQGPFLRGERGASRAVPKREWSNSPK